MSPTEERIDLAELDSKQSIEAARIQAAEALIAAIPILRAMIAEHSDRSLEAIKVLDLIAKY